MRKLTRVTDRTKFRILVDLCLSKGIEVCSTYQASFEDSYPEEDTTWRVFQLAKYSFGGTYEVLGTNGYDDELISYEEMIDYIISIGNKLVFNLSNNVDANYTKGDDYVTIATSEIQVIKLKELLDRINQLNA